ncbi:MAG: iron-containing alcohol dehydrogenase [Akkermansia sp.]|nr:iron-containing alcohol dehydrogenase [Akkermansia sp.]
MLNFNYCNPTRYVYGHGEHLNIGTLLQPTTRKVLLHYGGGSVKRSGLYDAIVQSLQTAGISYVELGGVKPNPTVALVRQGIELARAEEVDAVLAVGGGSVIDSAKAIALGTTHPGDVWKLYTREERQSSTPLPVAVILTLPAAGSENSPNTVLTHEESKRKLGYGDDSLRPALSIVSPELFLTLPPEQMAYGACDMLCHIFERYFTNTPGTELTDALGEATMRTIMQQASILRRNPQNEHAWGQLALAGTIAHNNLLGLGRAQSWACHGLEHELSAIYDVPHGAGLAVIVPAYFEHVWQANPGIFAQWATNVMGVTPSRDTELVVREGIARLRAWYRELGLPQTMQELGIPADADFAAMAQAALAVYGPRLGTCHLPGVKPVDVADAEGIYRACVAQEA